MENKHFLPSELLYKWQVKKVEKEKKLSVAPSPDLTRLSPNHLQQAGMESLLGESIDKDPSDRSIVEK